MSKDYSPKRYYVTVTVVPTGADRKFGITGAHTHRVGFADDLDATQRLIKEDRDAMRDTHGGFIEPTRISNRNYRIWKAEWTEVKI